MKWTRKEADFIKSQSVAHFATVSAQGLISNVPVCPLFDRGLVYIATRRQRQKLKNLEENSACTIVFDVYRDSWNGLRGVMLQCAARIVDEKQFRDVQRKLYKKYSMYASKAAIPAMQRLSS